LTTHLYLIRHGQAFCNVPPYDKVAGMRGDEGLTDLGKLQAERLRDRLTATGEIAADVLIASTLPRARQTAEIVAPALGLPIIWDDEVQELRVGEADGLLWKDYKDRLPDFREDPFRPFASGGENWPQFVARVGMALVRITREHAGKTVVVICHGGFIDVTFGVFFHMHTLRVPPVSFSTHNTSITHWMHREPEGAEAGLRMTKGDEAPWRLMKYNDDLHLRDIGAEVRILWPRIARERTEGAEEPAVPLPTEEE
jgi:probable phosphoglycerate mutase